MPTFRRKIYLSSLRPFKQPSGCFFFCGDKGAVCGYESLSIFVWCLKGCLLCSQVTNYNCSVPQGVSVINMTSIPIGYFTRFTPKVPQSGFEPLRIVPRTILRAHKKEKPFTGFLFCAPSRARTLDRLLKRELLYQLS